MKLLIAVILTLLTLAGLIILTVVQYPKGRTISYTVCKMVPEERMSKEKVQVQIKGETVEVEVPIRTIITSQVAEKVTKEIPPTANEWLLFGCRVLVAVIVGLYMLSMVVMLARDKWKMRKGSEDTRDTKQPVDQAITFCTGLLIGFFGSTDIGQEAGGRMNQSGAGLTSEEYPQVMQTQEVVRPSGNSGDEIYVDPGPAP